MKQVSLSDIEEVYESDLDPRRLYDLENGYSPFDEVLGSRSAPIALDCTSRPYRIINGRHRIFLARKKGYTSVPAVCA